MTAALAAIVVGGIVLMAGVRNRSVFEILQGITTARAEASTGLVSLGGVAQTSGAAVGGKGGNPAANRKLGHAMMLAAGWGEDQWHCLDALWTHESGWDDKADNPNSDAAGIPQDITGNLHGGAHGQIAWGLSYIRSRYGSPCKAWTFWQSHNWY